MARRDASLITVLTIMAVGAYTLGVLSHYAFTRCWRKPLNPSPPSQPTYSDHPRKTSSYGIDGSFTPIRPTFPSHFSFTKQYEQRDESLGSLSSETRGDKIVLHSDIEPKPHFRAWRDTSPLSSPYSTQTYTSFALNDAPQIPERAAPSSQSPVNPTTVRPDIPRRPTLEDLRSDPSGESSLITSEQPINHARSCSEPLSPADCRPTSSVAWHLPSRSRSITKVPESFRNEPSESDCSVYALSTSPCTVTLPMIADEEERNRPATQGAKIFEASRAARAPSSTIFIDPLLAVQDSVRSSPSPTPESIMGLYGSFPAPPESNRKESAVETRPRTMSNPSKVRAPALTTAYPTTTPAPLVRPFFPLTVRTHHGGSFSIPSPQLYGLPSRSPPAGASPAPRASPSSSSSQTTLTSPKRAYKSTSASGSFASLTDDAFLVPPRTPPTPRLATPSSLSSLRPKTPPRPTSSRNAIYHSPGSQSKDGMGHRRQI